MVEMIKRVAVSGLRLLPAPLRRLFRRRYYRRVVERYRESDWEWTGHVKPLVRPGGLVLDIGANVGYLSGLFATWVGAQGRVIAVEPIPATYDVLSSSMRALYAGVVTTLPVCISDQPGEVIMAVPSYADGGENYYESRVVSEGSDTGGPRFRVPATTIDRIIQDQAMGRTPDFIKIDVEGHELAAVRGAQALLTEKHPPVLIEVAGNPDAAGSPAEKLFALLAGWGFAPYLIKDNRLQRRVAGDQSVDYLFLHEAK